MPIKRKQGESKDQFIGRCIPIEMAAGKSNDQAVAMCLAQFETKQLAAVKRIRRANFKPGVPHYTADKKLWTGPTHKGPGGRLMTGAEHGPGSQFLYHEEEFMNFVSYTDYPKAAIENAQAALNYAEREGWGSCGTPVGKQRANQLAGGEPISEETIARMAAFERHRGNSDKKLGDGCGRLMWLAWGGDAGVEWATRKLKQIRGEDFTMTFKKQRVFVSSSNVKKMMWDDTTLLLTIEFNDGSVYEYEKVQESIFIDIAAGNAAPITSGENEYGSWSEGQKPSVGAAVHKYLIDKGKTGRQSTNQNPFR